MKTQTALFIAAALLVGACTSATEIQTAGTEKVYNVQCNGLWGEINQCKVHAGQVCPQGYTVLRQVEREGPVALSKTYTIDEIQRFMIIQCRR